MLDEDIHWSWVIVTEQFDVCLVKFSRPRKLDETESGGGNLFGWGLSATSVDGKMSLVLQTAKMASFG